MKWIASLDFISNKIVQYDIKHTIEAVIKFKIGSNDISRLRIINKNKVAPPAIIIFLSDDLESKNEKPSTLDQNNDKSRFKFSSLEVLSFSDLKFKKNSNDCNLSLLFPEDMKKVFVSHEKKQRQL